MIHTFHQTTLNFIDSYIETMNESEFVEWVRLSENERDFKEIIETLRQRLEALEYYDKLIILKKEFL